MSQDEELSELGRGVYLYSRLGLEFEGGDVGDDGSMKCLRLVFRQVRARLYSRTAAQTYDRVSVGSGVHHAEEWLLHFRGTTSRWVYRTLHVNCFLF